MTTQEFSDQFDVLYNNISSNQAPSIDEYEKSVFLTKALDEVIKSYFISTYNKAQAGFDGNEKRLIDFSMLMRTVKVLKVMPSPATLIHAALNVGFYQMPKDILLYINEMLNVNRDTPPTARLLAVVPLSYTEYSRLMSKPYKRPLKNLAWRLITDGLGTSYRYTDYITIANLIEKINTVTATSSEIYGLIKDKDLEVISITIEDEGEDITRWTLAINDDGTTLYLNSEGTAITDSEEEAINLDDVEDEERYRNIIMEYINKKVDSSRTIVEIIPGASDTITDYIVRYVARPTPIILFGLEGEGVSIEGYSQQMECILDPILHEEILQRAVELAKLAYNPQEANAYILIAGSKLSGTEEGLVTTRLQ